MRMVQISIRRLVGSAALSLLLFSAAQAETQSVLDCDRYAASNNDTGTTAGRAGVRFQDLDPGKAKPACEAAYRENPDMARLAFQLARTEVKLQNYERAKTLLEEAVSKGYMLAAVELGLIYDVGMGVPADLNKAAELYKQAADDGWAVGMSNLGDLYRLGLGVEQDLQKALELYEQAIARDHTSALGRKAMALAELYKDGDDPKPLVTALLQAASLSDGLGSANLGYAYLNGQYGLPVDPIAASVHLKRGYDLGQGWAGIYLALIEIARWDGDLQAADRLRQMLDTMAAGTDNELRAQALALKGQLGLLVGAPKADVADLIDRASALLPDDAIVLDSRATLMAAEGKFSEADALLEKATETAEDWAPYLAKRSVIQQKLGNATRSEELKTLAGNAVEGQYFLQFIEP